MKKQKLIMILAYVGIAASQSFSVLGQNLVQNGSLENLNKATFVNDGDNYMSLYAGSMTIADWTVTAATENEIVWAQSPTGDGYTAANGTYFVDLTGFGGDSPDGGIQQTLHGLIHGDTYQFSIDVYGNLPIVGVDAATVSLTPGSSFEVGTTDWTPETGTFIADGSDPLLTISNPGGGDIGFIDDISVSGPSSAVPDQGSSLALAVIGLASLCLFPRAQSCWPSIKKAEKS